MDRWEYLVSKEYRLRHHICEYFLDNVDGVIDVGAYKYTLPWDNVVAIDPLKTMEDSFHGTIREWIEQPYYFDITNCGVMALGLEIEGGEDEWNAFSNIVEYSKIAIIEHSIDHSPSVYQFNKIMLSTNKKIITTIELEFCDMQTPGFVPHKKRKLTVLERK